MRLFLVEIPEESWFGKISTGISICTIFIFSVVVGFCVSVPTLVRQLWRNYATLGNKK